jgi:hypothetical protein
MMKTTRLDPGVSSGVFRAVNIGEITQFFAGRESLDGTCFRVR